MGGDEKSSRCQGHHFFSGLAHDIVEDRTRKHHAGNANRSQQKHTAVLVPPAAQREGEHSRRHNQPQHRAVKGLAVEKNGRNRRPKNQQSREGDAMQGANCRADDTESVGNRPDIQG